MQTISFVQPNFQQGPTELNSYFLPYSVGCLWSYAESRNSIQQNFKLGHIIWRRDDINATAEKLSTSNVVAFSTYIWNRNYNYKLAQTIKTINPDCCVIFGGPEPPVTRQDFFANLPFINYAIVKEGEIIFADLLESLVGLRDIYDVDGILINDNKSIGRHTTPSRITDLHVLPSPYLSGFFDGLVAENPDVTWNATLETNRGCPYACTFCDWGSLTYNKVKQFDMQRLMDELEWIGKHCGLIYLADANFGMFIDRDRTIVEKVLEVSNRYGRLTNFYTSWAKNQKTQVVDLIERLVTGSKTLNPNGLTVSVQSLTPAVLDTIKRTNLQQHKLEEIFSLAKQRQIPVYTELILGLPNESLASFQDSVFGIIEAGNHHGIEIIQCQILENAEMNLVQRKLHKMETAKVYDYMSRSHDLDSDVIEDIEIVTATATMSRHDMLEAQTWSSFMHLFHMYGFSTQVSRYLAARYQVSYAEFYNDLWSWIKQDVFLNSTVDRMRELYDSWMRHGYLKHPITHEISQTGVNLITGLTLMVHVAKQCDHVLDVVHDFTSNRFKLDDNELDELITYQRCSVLWFDKLHQYPLQQKMRFDFHGYLDHGTDIDNPCCLQFNSPINAGVSFQRFHEDIYYGRKRGYGKSHVTRIKTT